MVDNQLRNTLKELGKYANIRDPDNIGSIYEYSSNATHVTFKFCEYFDEAPSFHKLPKCDCSKIGFLKMICRELNIDNHFDKLSFSVKDPSHIKHV